jgi:hypothetical protein
MRSKDLKSEHHITNLLILLVSLDKQQILKFLNHRYSQKDGKWVERDHDAEGRYITSFNSYLRLLSVFFRWLLNRTAVCVSMTPKLRTALKHQSAIENRPVCSIIETGMTDYLKAQKYK